VKRFRFRLAALLRYREFQEQQARQAVLEASRVLRECEADLARQQGRLDQARAACEGEALGGMTAERFLLFTRFVAGLEARRQTLLKKLDACRKRLADDVVQRQAVEKLKERRQSEYDQDMAKELQKQTEEIVLMHRGRKEKK
jgi:flagellar FliJ protein